MKQVMVKGGQVTVEDLPAPHAGRGEVLVRVDHSCISAGTEMSGIKAGGEPLWKKALRRPDQVRKVAQMAATQGVKRTKALVKGRLSQSNPTGYSAAGTVIAVGADVTNFLPGDRVACAGAQCAHHAEVISVPQNLTVAIPDAVSFADASTVTLGAIALQGVRRATPTLGETFVVIGLGLLGQLTVQMLKANGCKVIGVDLDRKRIALAEQNGLDVGLHPDDADDIEQVKRLTDGIGADGVLVTAASPSDEIMATAFKMCRKKGRVVLVGDVGLNLNRGDFYAKELDFFISTSYGPGRYDRKYEEEGMEYPVAYVRWTENRNMGAYLEMLAQGKLKLASLIQATYLLAEASTAYASLKGNDKPLIVLLAYEQKQTEQTLLARRIINPPAATARKGRIRVGLAGAGSFAQGMHLPNIHKLSSRYHLQGVMNRTAEKALNVTKLYAANYTTTDYNELLTDKDVDLVLICSRHDTHGQMTLDALRAGKHVMVEKPLALEDSELDAIDDFYAKAGADAPVLFTGYNRRFSPFAEKIRALTAKRTNPLMMNYRMNAGYIPLDHWIQTAEGGGRNRGEACHIYDLFTYLADSPVTDIQVQCVPAKTAHYTHTDNFVVTLAFEDGSVATLTYTALGSKEMPKEQLDVYCDGKVLSLNDYRSLKVYGAKSGDMELPMTDKGHQKELEVLADTLQQGGEWPIPLWQQMQVARIANAVERELNPALDAADDEAAE